jgi:hypothetical protein
VKIKRANVIALLLGLSVGLLIVLFPEIHSVLGIKLGNGYLFLLLPGALIVEAILKPLCGIGGGDLCSSLINEHQGLEEFVTMASVVLAYGFVFLAAHLVYSKAKEPSRSTRK